MTKRTVGEVSNLVFPTAPDSFQIPSFMPESGRDDMFIETRSFLIPIRVAFIVIGSAAGPRFLDI